MRKGGFPKEYQLRNVEIWYNEKYDQRDVKNKGSSEVFDRQKSSQNDRRG